MRNVRKNLNAYVDGRGYAGQVEEFNPPKLTLKTEEFRGGGMHAPVDLTMGHEKLTSDLSVICVDPNLLSRFDVAEGFNTQFTVREALESIDGSNEAVIHAMRGKVTEIDEGTIKPGEKAVTKLTFALSYYKKTVGARVVHEIDVPNMIFIRDGVDVLSGIRGALGI